MKVLITGISGFVGQYLKTELSLDNYKVYGIDRTKKENLENVFYGDIRYKNFIDSVIKEVKPDEIYHLAGFSSVRKSFEDPESAFDINVNGTRILLDSVRRFASNARVLIVSSAEVYGKPEKIPINENENLKESSPYSKSRIAQESLVNTFKDLDIVISRSFNHTGPGQTDTFVLPSFAKQTVEIEKGLREPVIYTGNLNIIRDFSDVRDVAKAYILLLKKGKRGEVYNIGSGRGYNLEDLLYKIISNVDKNIRVEQLPEKIRPMEISELIADISKVKKDTGWQPTYSIDKTLTDLLNYLRKEILSDKEN